MEGHHLHHHHLHRQQQQQHHHHHHQQQQQHSTIGGVAVVNVDVGDRFPQWSIQETKEFLMIRAELDQAFMETKRNKQLWEVISNRMKEKGFFRSPEQCKCKWKNLVTRYKGCETMEPEALRQQFPFYNEIQVIFAMRMQRMLWAEAEGTSKKVSQSLSFEEDDDNNEDDNSEGEKASSSKKNKTKKKKNKGKIIGSEGNYSVRNVKETLEEFMRQQMQMEAQWMEAYEAREKERRMREMEWRQTMEALENEKMMMDQRWREREEQRRVREELRAEKRDALVTALLNKLSREDLM